jgi:DNA-directed RNA polymerase III subunit RPC1
LIGNRGFSIGIADVTPGAVLSIKKDSMVAAAYTESTDLIQQSLSGRLENLPGCDTDQTLEAKIIGTLSKVRGDLGEICMQELTRWNAPALMATAGSKGEKFIVLPRFC